jgi:hypothetical protein
MRYVTDAWEPLGTTTTRDEAEAMEMRHYLVVAGLLLFVIVAPLGWIFTGKWAVASIISGVALLLISVAAILTPDSDDEMKLE